MAKKLKVTYVKSIIGGTQKQRDTIRSLGFHKLHQSRVVEDNPMFRGMITIVNHLVKVEEI
jgi:large subunit ribosomal protein L30